VIWSASHATIEKERADLDTRGVPSLAHPNGDRMHRRLAGSLSVVSLLATGCFVPKDKAPKVDLGAVFATKFVHRGMTLVDNPVVQPKLAVTLPTTTATGDEIGVAVEGNIDLRNDTGGAWFPDGHAGRFTQIEAIAEYARQIGDVRLTGGVHSYILPNGLEFQNGERGGTNEVFLAASMTVLEATPYASWHYDFDEVRGSYYRAGLTEDFGLGEGLSLNLDGSLGYVTEAQAAWMYGTTSEKGFADLRGSAVVTWSYDERTELALGVHGSMIVDNAIDEWFAGLRIDDDPIWFTAGVTWLF
jgi:hypothetical protein